MSHAPNYTPTVGFATEESNAVAGRSTIRTVAIDTELANASSSINALNTNIQLLQRDDGKLKDFIIEPYALSEQTRALIAAGGTPKGVWSAATAYAIADCVTNAGFAYLCVFPHASSSVFDTALWMSISGDGSAATSAINAAASAADALTSENNAETAAATATTKANEANASAIAAAASAVGSANSAIAAEANKVLTDSNVTASNNSAITAATKADEASASADLAATFVPSNYYTKLNSDQNLYGNASTDAPVRQTVTLGNYTSGVADMFTGNVGRTLAQGVLLSNIFAVTAGAGSTNYLASGVLTTPYQWVRANTQFNVSNRIGGMALFTPLVANTTHYFYFDTNNGTQSYGFFGYATLPPIYTYAPSTAPSTTLNQYTYNYATHIMYVGTGSGFTQVNRVFLGEIVTNATVITSATTYAYNGYYESGWTNTLPAAGETYTVAHNMGVKDYTFTEIIECITAEHGYAIGDQIENVNGSGGTTIETSLRAIKGKLTLVITRPSFNSYCSTTAIGLYTTLTPANWKYKHIVRRTW